MEPLLSNAEIEALFAWPKNKASVYIDRGYLGSPYQTLKCGRLFKLSSILEIAQQKGWNVNESALRNIYASVTDSST
ncbi:hypothetical protein [Brevibacillus choshinensis]|uniref:Transposase n=1 Tax=Brevibacillus choshinensis TaxID=54911 RepID=A0ABX7FGF0_BRECH|nr:hypothetical protein [Brevibacillus choshinensis]QRG65269.1 hypothetical protein JNE38_16635 [Brevibacillus choshinensis]